MKSTALDGNGIKLLARIKAIYYRANAMNPDQEQALKAHLQVIAKILYDNRDPDAM